MTRRTGPTWETVDLILARSGMVCEKCHRRPVAELHHRCGRQMGGTRSAWINTPSNLAHLCGDCHRYVTSHVEVATLTGWVVPRGVAERHGPHMVPVTDDEGLTYLLADDGQKTRTGGRQ